MKHFIFILFFLTGIVIGGVLTNLYNLRARRVDFNTYLTSLRTLPYQPENPSEYLFAFVAQGKLKYIDIVFPNVPYDSPGAYAYWKNICMSNPGIAYSYANPSYTNFEPSGKQPFHLCIWFKPGSQKIVRELVKTIDERYSIKNVVGEHQASNSDKD